MSREIYFAGGCFWGVERYFSLVPGVENTEVGFVNGITEDPTYEAVHTGDTGYAEAVKVCYDPKKILLEQLLELFFDIIDPTSVNRQGDDVGAQYRTGIYYLDPADQNVILEALRRLQEECDKSVAVECAEVKSYYPAGEDHQKYLEKNPGGYCHIDPSKFSKAKRSNFYRASDEELKSSLTEIQYRVTRENDTEAPFENEYFDTDERGIYVDITTGEPLFSSQDKFDSGCGWPSFSKPVSSEIIEEREDLSYNRRRTEVRSKKGDAHLGHVFQDGPEDRGGLRYCINSAALRFIPEEDMEKEGYGDYKL